MALVDFEIDSHVAIVSLNGDENRFNPSFLETFLQVMDQIENDTEATTMVVHSSHEKIFSNGIDLEWIVPAIQQKASAAVKRFFYQLNDLFRRLVTYPLITIAAINGHAFAGGAILCSAFDFRFMRSDRGYFCLPEIDLGIPFFLGMNAILGSAIPQAVLRDMQMTGARLTADECLEYKIVKGAFHEDQLMDEVLKFAHQVNKQRPIIREIKTRLNGGILHALDEEDPHYIEAERYFLG
jgi:enoyl-CoA hydratase/carnithine racemase